MKQEEYISLKEGYKVYTNRVGKGDTKLLTLHGGPGLTHECFANFPEYLNPEGIQVIFYDQLGSFYSDQPEDPSLWHLDRFVDELHQVVKALHLEDAFVYANSTGVILLIEYLLKYGTSFKGVIMSGMPTSWEKFQANILYFRNQLPASVLNRLQELEAGGDIGEAYFATVFSQWYQRHYCLQDPWPQAMMHCLQHAAYPVMQQMVGLSPFFYEGNLTHWNRGKEELQKIKVPSLLMGFPQDVVVEEDYQHWQHCLPDSRYYSCKKGGHLGWWDSPEEFFTQTASFCKALSKEA